MNKSLRIIVDMQFGSCGKGLIAGYLAGMHQPDTIVTAWAPNAGHTFISETGRKCVNIALPNGIIAPGVKRVLLGPGSVINPAQLKMELEQYADLMEGVTLAIHENAAIVTEAHREAEAAYGFGIGSTMKGVGEAVIQKIRRRVADNNTAGAALLLDPLGQYVVSKMEYDDLLRKSQSTLLEGAQGYSLGINSGMYPYTTSRECVVAQMLSDCGLPFDMVRFVEQLTVTGVCRTFPIRVSNRFKDGVQIGWSGPCYPDQYEMNWSDLDMEPERTTVTNLPRRIFTFSHQQVQEAIWMNGVDEVFLNFANYIPKDRRAGAPELRDYIKMIENGGEGASVKYIGNGPTVNDVVEV